MRKLAFFFVALAAWSCGNIDTNEQGVIVEQVSINNGWEFSEQGKELWYKAKVPGSVHMDLFNNELIEDPFYEDNEKKQQWIEAKNWTYKTRFEIDSVSLSKQNNSLRFNGLDTYAKVYLNNSLILTTNNMFRTWDVSVKKHLKLGENELRIELESPITHNKEAVNTYPHTLPSGNEGADVEVKVSNFTRKAAYQFGWDWGPRFVTSGIWKPIQLMAWNNARITHLSTNTLAIMKGVAEMETTVEIEVSEPGNYEINIDGVPLEKRLNEGLNIIKHSFQINKPKLWSIKDLEQPFLYKQIVILSKENQPVFFKESRFGVRTIKLINQPDSIGTSFYFKLNGEPLFMKGANYIPQDIFLSRVSPEKYKALLRKAKNAGINMLRVWGGGIYERDIFYESCDELGILVWQDFMFAGSLYPESDSFTKNVRQEVIDNIKRLRKHPCLALWCGNNEIEVAWKNWGWQKQYSIKPEDSIRIWDYQRYLFRELIPGLVKTYSPNIDYTPTSPLSNWGTPENFNHSSMHYWGVWHGREPFENFQHNVGRFMVEYGFQSFPSIQTLSKSIDSSNLYLESDVMKARQKSYIGNGLIKQHIEQYCHAPNSFEEFVELSQQTQAKGLSMAIKAHLNQQPHCMGTLFWQLNDCWPGPSWSVIDYYGNEKIAYDSVKVLFTQ